MRRVICPAPTETHPPLFSLFFPFSLTLFTSSCWMHSPGACSWLLLHNSIYIHQCNRSLLAVIYGLLGLHTLLFSFLWHGEQLHMWEHNEMVYIRCARCVVYRLHVAILHPRTHPVMHVDVLKSLPTRNCL